MEEIALVTAIKGVCKEWLTFQITWNPTKTDRTKTIKCCIKLTGAIRPRPKVSKAPVASRITCCFVCALKASASCALISSGVSSFGFSWDLAAIAWTLGGGGGNVTSLLKVTVAPRITSSSIL